MYFEWHIRVSRWNVFIMLIGLSVPKTHAQVPSRCTAPAEFERAIQKGPSVGAYDALGAYFAKTQQLSCAVDAFRTAVHLQPNSWEARFNLGLAYIQSQQPAKALQELKVATSIRPSDPMAHTALGMALANLNRNDEAVEEFELTLKTDPNPVP